MRDLHRRQGKIEVDVHVHPIHVVVKGVQLVQSQSRSRPNIAGVVDSRRRSDFDSPIACSCDQLLRQFRPGALSIHLLSQPANAAPLRRVTRLANECSMAAHIISYGILVEDSAEQ